MGRFLASGARGRSKYFSVKLTFFLMFFPSFPSAAVGVKRIVFTYQLPAVKADKKPLPRLIVPHAVKSRGRCKTAIAIFASNCSSHFYTISNNNRFLRAGKNHSACGSLQSASHYNSGFAADVTAAGFHYHHRTVI